jgi:hypothetical protein
MWEYFPGKLVLEQPQERNRPASLPVPPTNQCVYLSLFSGVVQQIEEAEVESFRICCLVCPGEYAHRAQGKTDLFKL